MIKKCWYVLAVKDLEISLAFYRDVLGFTIKEIGDPGWRIFERDECQIMAGHCPDSVSVGYIGDHSYFAYFIVDNINKYYADVVKNGVEILKEITSEQWGMHEFCLRTVDGHRIMIGQEIEKKGPSDRNQRTGG